MLSERLSYQPVGPATLDDFHALVRDEHVRRYLMDGELFPRSWSEERVRDSQTLFERRGVGIWLAYDETPDKVADELVGFCGFLHLPSTAPEPQLVYALRERFSGKGYGTEMARASIAEARRHPGFAEIVATVDEVNAASLRILEKLRFERVTTLDGSFGPVFVLRLELSESLPI